MTERNGILRRQEFTTRQRAQRSAGSNARNTTVGKTHSALPILRQQLVQDFLQMQVGTRLQALHRHGTAQAGNRRQQEFTTRHHRQANAVSDVI